jgi:predicted DNA-binding transcriptional regulator AlpA
MHVTEMTEPLMTVHEVAKMLSMSTAWVRQHSDGQRQPTIPSLKLGNKSVRFSRPSVVAWVKTLERTQ